MDKRLLVRCLTGGYGHRSRRCLAHRCSRDQDHRGCPVRTGLEGIAKQVATIAWPSLTSVADAPRTGIAKLQEQHTSQRCPNITER